jgi:hypothetical protein
MATLTATSFSLSSPANNPWDLIPDGLGNVWVTDSVLNYITKIRISDGSVLGVYSLSPNSLPLFGAFDGTNVWVLMFGATNVDNVLVVNPAGSVADAYATSSPSSRQTNCIVFDGTNMWVQTGNDNSGKIVKMLASNGSVLATYSPSSAKTSYSDCRGIAWDGTYVWFSDENANLWQLDSAGTAATEFAYGTYPDPNSTGTILGPIFAGGALWISDGENTINKINPSTGALIATYTMAGTPDPTAMASDGTNLWTLNGDGSVTIIALSNGAVVGNFTLAAFPGAGEWNQISWDGANMWASAFDNSIVKMTLSVAPSRCQASPQSLAAWLVINEPPTGSPAVGGGLTDRTPYLFKGAGHQNQWHQELRQRGQATIHLTVAAGDPYQPTRGTQIFLWEQTSAGFGPPMASPATTGPVFAGLIQDIENQYFGNGGDHYVVIKAVSLESVFDTVYVSTPVQLVNQTCGAILTAIFNQFENGAPVSLGTIQAGPTVAGPYVPKIGTKLSAVFDELATTAEFTWGVDPATQLLFFQQPSSSPAPFTLTSPGAGSGPFPLWDTLNWKINGQDYRNRQGVRLSYDAFPHSMAFFTGAGQTAFTLPNAVQQVTNAWVTLSTPNTATGSFSGQPSPGDTVTIGPFSAAWIHNHIYALGGTVVYNGYVFQVTGAGTSGPTLPNFAGNLVIGDTVPDDTVTWTNIGTIGLSTGTATYTFVSTLDNTQFGQVLIGATLAATVQNLVDAINAAAPYGGPPPTNGKGLTISLPTWENSQCNAISVTGTGFTLQQKAAGSGWIAAISASSGSFSWSGTQTSGGTSPLGSNVVAPGSIPVYVEGTATSAPCLVYTPGSATVDLATPLNSGSNLNIEYTRVDGDVIECERTDLVKALASTACGTGKYQQMTDQSGGLIATSLASGLQLAQQALAAFDVAPQYLTFETYMPGLKVGQTLTVALTYPAGSPAVLNGQWVIETVEAELVAVPSTGPEPYLPGYGHFKYTITCINIQQIGSWLDFWQSLGGTGAGGGGVGAGSSLVATSGGAAPTTVPPPVTGGVIEITGNYTAKAADGGSLIAVSGPVSPVINPIVTLPSPPPSTTWNVFVQNIGTVFCTINPSGLDIDGSASTLTILPGEGVYVSTDGTNYFTERGIGNPNAVTAVTATSPIASTGGKTPNISYDGTSIEMLVGSSIGYSSGWQLKALSSNPTQRVLLQSATTNAPMGLVIAPNGSGTIALSQYLNGSDLTLANVGVFSFVLSSGNALLQIQTFGSGIPITTFTLGENVSTNLTSINFKLKNVIHFSVVPGAIQTIGVTTVNLPSSPAAGMRATVTDAVTPVVGVALTGGGSVFANVHWSPTTSQWIVDGI